MEVRERVDGYTIRCSQHEFKVLCHLADNGIDALQMVDDPADIGYSEADMALIRRRCKEAGSFLAIGK